MVYRRGQFNPVRCGGNLIVYQTDKMEKAIFAMMTRHTHCMVWRQYACLKRIYLRFNSIPGVTPFVIRPRDKFHVETVARWREKGGLLLRSYDSQHPKAPDCDAILFPETPIQQRFFESYCGPSVKEAICYRPPSWKLHEETVAYKFPTVDSYRTVLSVIDALVGRTLPTRLAACLKLSGFDPSTTAVFEAAEMMAITGVSERQLRNMLNMASMKIKTERYHCYVPTIEPDDADSLEFYARLRDLPEVYRGERMLRYDLFPGCGRLDGQNRIMGNLCKANNVQKKPHIYLAQRTGTAPDFTVIEGITNARLNDWEKMRYAVDAAPVYDISI